MTYVVIISILFLYMLCIRADKFCSSFIHASSNLKKHSRILKLKEFSLTSDNIDGVSDTLVTFVPPEVGIEIYAGSVAGLIPIVWATYEFSKRILIQRKCLVCQGSGLTDTTRSGNKIKKLRKCWSCGGFLPVSSIYNNRGALFNFLLFFLLNYIVAGLASILFIVAARCR